MKNSKTEFTVTLENGINPVLALSQMEEQIINFLHSMEIFYEGQNERDIGIIFGMVMRRHLTISAVLTCGNTDVVSKFHTHNRKFIAEVIDALTERLKEKRDKGNTGNTGDKGNG